jgi:hypothetical protein
MAVTFTAVTAADLAAATPDAGEYVRTTDSKNFYLGDGSTQGGIQIGGLSPRFSKYAIAGLGTTATGAAYLSGSTLTLPLDGRIYDYTLSANITIAFSGAPTAPDCGSCTLYLRQAASGTLYTVTAWPTAKWPYGLVQFLPQKYDGVLKIAAETGPDGTLYLAAQEVGSP